MDINNDLKKGASLHKIISVIRNRRYTEEFKYKWSDFFVITLNSYIQEWLKKCCHIRNLCKKFTGYCRIVNMADDTDKSDFTDDEAISGNDNPFSNKQASHKGIEIQNSIVIFI